MHTRTKLLTATAALALLAAPGLAQQNTGGSSQMQGTTQTTPQQGATGGLPAARDSATTGRDVGGSAPAGQASGTPGGSPGRAPNPSGAATGPAQPGDGGRGAASGVPGMPGAGGQATGNDARGGVTAQGGGAPRDGAPGNPPSTATQRAADGVTGNRTDADGTGNNPPGTAAGRALDNAAGGTAATGGAATGSTGGAAAVDSARLREGRRASRVIGSTVYNEQNESVGSVDDLIVPQAGGAPVAIVSVGGFLGIGARLVAVPYDRLQYNSDRDRWMLQGATRDSLQSLPAFEYADRERRG